MKLGEKEEGGGEGFRDESYLKICNRYHAIYMERRYYNYTLVNI